MESLKDKLKERFKNVTWKDIVIGIGCFILISFITIVIYSLLKYKFNIDIHPIIIFFIVNVILSKILDIVEIKLKEIQNQERAPAGANDK